VTDRELLEAAAKAAGIEVHWLPTYNTLEPFAFYQRAAGVFRAPVGTMPYGPIWNPLLDDGSAFRLAVKLGMKVYVDIHPQGCDCVEAVSIRPGWRMEDRAIVNIDGDPLAATRRAIVRAAAEIGRAMP
jgi:hypothetical protein